MNGPLLERARKNVCLTQSQVAKELGVSQPYVSMVERGERTWPKRLSRRVLSVYGLPPTFLPLRNKMERPLSVNPDELAKDLAALGYPGFSYVRTWRKRNPAEVLFTALAQPELDSRLTEALPWVVYTYADLDWKWLTKVAKSNDLQNRLGFVTNLARRLAELNPSDHAKAQLLAQREVELERSRLEREDTLCKQSLTAAERSWLEQNRPPEAAQWHLWTDLAPQHLAHVAPAS